MVMQIGLDHESDTLSLTSQEGFSKICDILLKSKSKKRFNAFWFELSLFVFFQDLHKVASNFESQHAKTKSNMSS